MRRVEERRQEAPVFGRKMYVNHPLVPGRPPTKVSLSQRLHIHAATRRPPLAGLHIRYRGAFAYIEGRLADGESIPLMRLRYTGSATHWGFALSLASNNGYQDTHRPTGPPSPAPPKRPSTTPASCTC